MHVHVSHVHIHTHRGGRVGDMYGPSGQGRQSTVFQVLCKILDYPIQNLEDRQREILGRENPVRHVCTSGIRGRC